MKKLLSLFFFAALWLPGALASADEYKDFDPSKATPTVSAPLFVVITYSAIWIVALLFVVLLWRRQRRVQEELEDVQRRLSKLLEEGAE